MAHEVHAKPTPNPNAYRFGFEADVFGGQSLSFPTPESAAGTPWAEALHALEGVEALFAVRDFVTVTKGTAASWNDLVPRVVEVLAGAGLPPA